MTNLLTPQEVLQALIDGQDVEFKENNSDDWYEFNEYFAIKYLYEESLSFRLKAKKQEMITIGDYVDGKPVFEAPEAHGTWVSVDDELPSISDQYWVAYNAIHYENKDEELEFDYCTAHFNTDEKQWYIKDQLFYKQRQCKVVYWQPLPELPKQT